MIRLYEELREYQLFMVRMMWKIRYVLIAVDMSLGKTVATLTFICEYLDKYPRKKILIVAPYLVAQDTWPDEIRNWHHIKHLPFSVLMGTPAQRIRALRKPKVQVHIINKENLAWLFQYLGKNWDYDVIIIDEASMLKEGKHRTLRAGGGKGSRPLSRFGILAAARKRACRVIELTGTPAPEGIHNMWGLMYILDLGDRLGAKKTHFTRRWFDTGFKGWAMDPLPGAEKEITKLCSDLMVSLRAEDHIKLPPVVTTPVTDIRIDMPKELMREYRKFERELFTEKYDVEAATSGVLVNKLLQWSNGSIYRERGVAIPIHDLKVDALERLIESLDGHPLLVACTFKFDFERIAKRLGKKYTQFDKTDKNVLKKWNAGKIKVLGCHPASLGHGTNLQFGGHNLVHYGLCHSGELYSQINGRLPRPGQPAPHVFIRHIIMNGTWDDKVLDNHASKGGVQAALRKAVRIRRQEVMEELRVGRD